LNSDSKFKGFECATVMNYYFRLGCLLATIVVW